MSAAMSRGQAMLAGLGESTAALGASELLAGLIDRTPSPVSSVAGLFIAETPGGIVRWSIDTFGARQKTLLVTGIVVGSLLAGGALGVAARRSLRPAVAGFIAFGALGGWAAGRDRLVSDSWGWFAAAVSASVGIGSLGLLRAAGTRTATTAGDEASTADRIGVLDRRRESPARRSRRRQARTRNGAASLPRR